MMVHLTVPSTLPTIYSWDRGTMLDTGEQGQGWKQGAGDRGRRTGDRGDRGRRTGG